MDPPAELLQAMESNDTKKVSVYLDTINDNTTAINCIRLVLEKAVDNETFAKLVQEKAPKLALKGEDGLSILDILAKSETDNKLVKDILIQPLLLTQNNSVLELLATSGWSDFSLQSDTETTEEVKKLMATLTDLRIKATLVQAAIRDGRLEDVKAALTTSDSDSSKGTIFWTSGISGLFPLHQAVVYNHEEIVKHILLSFSEACGLQNSMGRTGLHYAAGCDDEGNLYQILKDAGSDEDVPDKMGNTPKYYLENPEKLKAFEVRSKLERLMKGGDNAVGSRPASASTTKPEEEATAMGQQQQTINDDVQTQEQENATQEEPEKEIPRAETPPKPQTPPPGPKKVQPVPMYVRPGGQGVNQTQAPPPTTLDGKYIAQHLGTALTLALAEIAEKRPWDPIEYLAFWLHDFHKNEAYAKKQAEMLKTIREAEAKQNEIEELKFKRKEELLRLQEDEMRKKKEEEEEKRRQEMEELQRSNKEAALAQKPQLPTVREDEEAEPEPDLAADDDPNVKDRDIDGLTEMHKLASQEHMDMKSLMNLGYSIADRDIKGRCVRDIAQEAGRRDTVTAIDNYTKQLLSDGVVSTLETLVLEGYDVIESLADDTVPEVTKNFLQNMQRLKEQMHTATDLSEKGTDEEIKEALTSLPQLIQIKDLNGRSLLHCGVISNNRSVAEYLATQYPNLLHTRDNKNRTPLHYAHGKSDDLATLLINKGAKQNARDVYKKVPAYYKDHPENDNNTTSPQVISESEPVMVTVIQPAADADESNNSTNAEQSSHDTTTTGELETSPDASQLATTSVPAETEQQTT